MSATKIAMVNQKGGVAKSTTSIALAAWLAKLGYKTLLCDVDPQFSTTQALGFMNAMEIPSMNHVLIEGKPMKDIIVKTEWENLYMAPSNIDLAGFDIEVVTQIGRETILKEALNKLEQEQSFDYMVFDCPPNLSFITINGLSAANYVIVPIKPDPFSLSGVNYLLQIIKMVKDKVNPDLDILGAVLTDVDRRRNITERMELEVRSFFGKRAFEAWIGQDVQVVESIDNGVPLPFFNEKTRAAQQYMDFTKEVVARCQKNQAE